ncbi:MAG TPA: oxygen-insensitive NAD(P)H nitroreductase [Fibrobacteraceae bacterium]|nr:oxygen-insensitive NAD(P)H nitroreductase [Fibrobacteraceae bacterium]
MNLTEIFQKRYSTKAFDPSKRIAPELFVQLESLLRLSPSSVNSQPWHFLIADTPQGRERLTCATQVAPYDNNRPKIIDASHVIVFCAKTTLDDAYLEALAAQEDKDGRFPQPVKREKGQKARLFYVDLHRKQRHDTEFWMQRQVYLNLGTLLFGAALLGIDAVPIEGYDNEALDREFNLPIQGLSSMAMVALGYRAETDFNAKLPKSRWPLEHLVTRV